MELIFANLTSLASSSLIVDSYDGVLEIKTDGLDSDIYCDGLVEVSVFKFRKTNVFLAYYMFLRDARLNSGGRWHLDDLFTLRLRETASEDASG